MKKNCNSNSDNVDVNKIQDSSNNSQIMQNSAYSVVIQCTYIIIITTLFIFDIRIIDCSLPRLKIDTLW